MKNGLYYKEHFQCPKCKELFLCIFPMAYVMVNWQLARLAIASYDLDKAIHRADCLNAIVKDIWGEKI